MNGLSECSMQTLLPTLLDYDPGLLAIIAHRWDVDVAALDKRQAAEALTGVMLDPDRAAAEWARLNDAERGALQTLLAAPEQKMTEAQFGRLFGQVRRMGPGRRDREKPHLNSASVTETLYYRGLIALAFDQAKAGMQPFVYVPPDLAAVLPTHETGFDLHAEAEPVAGWHREGFEPESMRPATTTAVDDLTTLLAYLQINRVPSDKDTLYRQVSDGLAECWLGEQQAASIALLIALAGSMGLAANQDGIFKPVPAQARRWLEDTRPRQVRALAEAWRDCTLFNDLWYVPGVQLEDTGWRNDPLLARQTVLTFLEMVPPADWWPVDELIALVKAEEPDFQRPAGDYDSWYIRDAETGDYLRGFESWDRVDGAVLHFILIGPMHWLGLVDLSNEGTYCRLTVYGRALCGESDWPDPLEEHPHLTLESDGTILASRTLSRYERFQLARIAEWGEAGDPYLYRLTAAGLQQAAAQGIQPDAIQAFLRRTSGGELPETVHQMLGQWAKTGSADVWMEPMVVLRTTSPDALQTILDTPELRRYLGAALGPTAVMVRGGQENELATALREHGMLVDFEG
jgi:hypothetical protein